MISNNYVPEKIAEFNAYIEGNRMIGVGPELELPEAAMKTGTTEGAGISGEIDSPTMGQFESMEQEVKFNTLYSSYVDMFNPGGVVDLTIRAAQQVLNKDSGYEFKGLRIVERGIVKTFAPGTIQKAESMEATVTLELTYLMIEVDGVKITEIDKVNMVYFVNGHDMMAEIRALT